MLGRALRLIRVFHDKNQSDLVDVIGVSKSYISEIEAGKKTPSFEVLQRYSDFFKIPLSSIMFFAENVGEGRDLSRARGLIASKIIKMLELIEERASDGDRDATKSKTVSD